MQYVRTISVGRPQDRDWAGIGRTSIDKRAVLGPVDVHELGVAGDQVSDTRHHGGPDQAVYAYAREDLDFFEGLVGAHGGDSPSCFRLVFHSHDGSCGTDVTGIRGELLAHRLEAVGHGCADVVLVPRLLLRSPFGRCVRRHDAWISGSATGLAGHIPGVLFVMGAEI